MEQLQRIIARLRKECPWDRKQTVFTVRNSVIEEAYELAEAIRDRDYAKIKEEAGDYIFVGLFIARILEDTGRGSVREVLDGISAKLIHRHPHVFQRQPPTAGRKPSLTAVRTAEDVLANWNRIKETEKGRSILDSVPRALPALQRAESIQQRARRVGFDWHDPRDVLSKVVEEVEEIRAELTRGTRGTQSEKRKQATGCGPPRNWATSSLPS